MGLAEAMSGLETVAQWPVERRAAGWITIDGDATTTGDLDHQFQLASVTKLLFAMTILVAVEEGSLSYSQPAGPPGATVSHLLSHTSGLSPEGPATLDPNKLPTSAEVGAKRIYSNLGFEMLGQILEQATGIAAAEYLHEAIVAPLGLSRTALTGSPAHGAHSTVTDLLVVTAELLKPTLISPETLTKATTPFLGDISGVLPGYGRQDPNPWGLGIEIRGHKRPHWTGSQNSPSTFGHFGRAGTFLWVDPSAKIGCVGLADRDFGPWAIDAWPRLSDDVLQTSAR